MTAGSSIVSVSSLAAAAYREHLREVAPLLDTATMQEGIDWCDRHREALGNGYQLSKEAIILYTMRSATPLGGRGIRINCTGPGVTETPILDQLRTAYGQGFLDDIPSRWDACPNRRSRRRCCSSSIAVRPVIFRGRLCG